MNSLVKGDSARTTRGMRELTLAELPGGLLLMVLRGSNDRKPELPSHTWSAGSHDGGLTWTAAEPWLCTDGRPFFSPSACPQLLAHSSGRLFWLGNVAQENPRGNLPRYPFVVADVDLDSGRLIRSSLHVIDTRQSTDAENLMLSNFYACEDRETREICLRLARLFPHPTGWEGSARLYRLNV